MNNVSASTTKILEALSPDALEARLFEIGAERYHNLHPFHELLHNGELNRGQVQAWALNRYCYQAAIPMKDASLMGRIEDRELRKQWLHRVTDHDGYEDDEGGIMRWLILTDGLGLDRDYVISRQGALPAVRFAVEAYIRYVREQPLLQAIASSLTELFAPKIHRDRIAGMLKNYDFIDDKLMSYGTRRLNQAPVDAEFALNYVRQNAVRVDQQQQVIEALLFKLNVLWIQLDALHLAYVEPKLIPPGAFIPEE
jgi:pyrroloquinoline-quinone synthase